MEMNEGIIYQELHISNGYILHLLLPHTFLSMELHISQDPNYPPP